MYVFGDRVNFTHRFIRTEKTIYGKPGYGKTSWKIWETEPYNGSYGIFLGYRTLKNGTRWFDSEAGWIFTPKEHFKAALICPSKNRNPVFVPVDCMERTHE